MYWIGDFPLQEYPDILAVRDVFVVLHVVPVRPFDGNRFIRIDQGFFKFLGGIVLRFESEFDDILSALNFHLHAEGQVALVEVQFLLHVRCGEILLVSLCDNSRLIFLICLPENDADLVVGKVLALEDFDMLVGVTLGPAFLVALFDPSAMRVGNAVTFVPKGFWLFLELLSGVD